MLCISGKGRRNDELIYPSNLTRIRENGATTGVGVLATYAYDNVARRSSVTFGNGTSQSYAYDGASRLQTHTTALAATANDLTQTFSYNPASQIASVTRSNDAYAWTGHFNQNDNSTPNGLNQLVNVGAKTITHDARGGMSRRMSAYGLRATPPERLGWAQSRPQRLSSTEISRCSECPLYS